MQLVTLRQLLVDELQEVYVSESLISAATGRMVENATADPLREALTNHSRQTEQQLARIQSVFETLGESPRGGHGKSMRALLSEAEDRMSDPGDPDVIDAALIASARRIEHWEIASYTTAHIFSERLGLDKVAALLAQTLAEEQSMDLRLLELARQLPLKGTGRNDPRD